MKSINNYLCTSQIVLQSVLIILFSALLYTYVRKVLVDEFDTNLHRAAESLTQKIMIEGEGGQMELDIEELYFPEFDYQDARSGYVIRDNKGEIVLASTMFKATVGQVPESSSNPVLATDTTMPDGNRGRYTVVEFSPKPPEITGWSIMVVRERNSIDRALSTLLAGCVVCGGSMIFLSVLASGRSVRRGLGPLRSIGEEVDSLDASNLSHRFDVAKLPRELSHIGEKLNDLLERLESAFERERRFAGNAAHELRTPLAELKAIVQVGAGWCPRDLPEDDPRTYFADAEETIHRMERLVVTLLALIDHEPSSVDVELEKTDLTQWVFEFIAAQQSGAADRSFHLHGPEQLIVMSDPILLHGILTNLFDNCQDYSPTGAEIHCTLGADAGYATLTLRNPCGNLCNEDMTHLWEPLWRASNSRADSDHHGLGLSIVKTYAECMNWQISATLVRPDQFEIGISGIVVAVD